MAKLVILPSRRIETHGKPRRSPTLGVAAVRASHSPAENDDGSPRALDERRSAAPDDVEPDAHVEPDASTGRGEDAAAAASAGVAMHGPPVAAHDDGRGSQRSDRARADAAQPMATWDPSGTHQPLGSDDDGCHPSELTFRCIADAAPATLWTTDESNRCTFRSRAWGELTGQRKLEGLVLGWTDALHADDRGAATAKFMAASERREPFTLEYRLRRRDGAYRWVIDSGRPRFDQRGAWLGYVGSVVDITDQRQTELLLEAQKLLLGQIAAGCALGECLDSLCSTVPVLHAGARACVLLIDAEKKTLAHVSTSQGLDGFGHSLARAARHGTSGAACEAMLSGHAVECTDIATDEGVPPAWRKLCTSYGIRAGHAVPVVGYDGRARGAFALWLDETRPATEWERRLCELGAHVASIALERERAQLELMRGEERFRSLVDVITDIPWLTDASGAFAEPQPAWEAYTGQAWEAHRGFGWLQALHPEDRARAEQAWREACLCPTMHPYHMDARLWHAASGTWRHIVTKAVSLYDADGSHRESVGSCTDVEDQTRAQADLQAADRRKDEFLATLAHELRNPLTPIRNAIELLRADPTGSTAQARAREMIDRQSKQMMRLIDDLMEVSRITTGRLRLKRERVDLASVIQTAIETSAPLFEQRQHALTTHMPQQAVPLYADPTRLAQVFSNLLNNAARYTDPGGQITLRAEVRRGQAVATVVDDGIGIAPQMLTAIFDLFVQADRSLERSQAGLGIGLTLAKRLVEMHGGRVEAHSEGLGTGASFRVVLPIETRGHTRPRETKRRPSAPTVRLRILVADDNIDAAESLAMLLRMHGHAVAVVHDGLGAVRHAAQWRPDVVLLDIAMPGLNGYEAARRIRAAAGREMPTVIALTGWGQDEDRKRSAEAGFDHHLVKPVDPGALAAILSSAAERRRPASDG
jgi:two-component system CheB/CheR fusion protein